jgi:hypothetical protein
MSKFDSTSSWFGLKWPWRLFITRSDAMRPSIFAGDVLVVRRPPRDADDYGVGDVIAYDSSYRGMSPCVRRICMVMHPSSGVTQYMVRRDADGLVADSIVDSSHVIGEVEARLVNVGRIIEGNTARSHRSLSRFATAPNARRAALAGKRDHQASATESAAE